MQQPRQYIGDEQFALMLQEYNCPMPLYQVKAFVLGCQAATAMPGIDAILSALWGEETPTFTDRTQLEGFTGQFIALWNAMVKQSEGETFLLSPAAVVTSLADAASFAARRKDELDGFFRGLDAGNTKPQQLTADGRQVLEALEASLTYWVETERMIRELPAESPELVSETAENLRQLDQVTADAMRVLIHEQRRRRLEQAKAVRSGGGTYVKPTEPGRNDLCPCGSGKKYKKCHGK